MEYQAADSHVKSVNVPVVEHTVWAKTCFALFWGTSLREIDRSGPQGLKLSAWPLLNRFLTVACT